MATPETILKHRGLTLVLSAGSEQHEAEIETTVLQPRRSYQSQYAEALA